MNTPTKPILHPDQIKTKQ